MVRAEARRRRESCACHRRGAPFLPPGRNEWPAVRPRSLCASAPLREFKRRRQQNYQGRGLRWFTPFDCLAGAQGKLGLLAKARRRKATEPVRRAAPVRQALAVGYSARPHIPSCLRAFARTQRPPVKKGTRTFFTKRQVSLSPENPRRSSRPRAHCPRPWRGPTRGPLRPGPAGSS
jgi:hypothetical protein